MNNEDELLPDLMKQNISKENIMKLFKSLCKHKKEYNGWRVAYPDFDWSKCHECVLNKIVHYVHHGFEEDGVIKRDVCFAIWHDHEIDGLSRKKKSKIKKKKDKKEKSKELQFEGKRARSDYDEWELRKSNREALSRMALEIQDNQR